MFSTDFIFRQQENLVDNQKCWAGFRPLCNKILLLSLQVKKVNNDKFSSQNFVISDLSIRYLGYLGGSAKLRQPTCRSADPGKL